MRNVFLKTSVCLFLMALFPIQGLAAGWITAEGVNGLITPLGNDSAIVMDKEDGILDIYWIEGNRIKNEVHMPYDEYNWNVVPTEKGWPELVLHVNDSWTWAMWLDGGIYQFRELATYPTIVKPEGLFFSHLDFLNETYEFMNMDGETILHIPQSPGDKKVCDIVWDELGWILFLPKGDSWDSIAVRRINLDGSIGWEYSEEVSQKGSISGEERIISDGKGGAWFAYNMDGYTGAVTIKHIDSNGHVDVQHRLVADDRVKYIDCGRILENGDIEFYGTSVANSKGIFHVFKLQIDTDGEFVELDVREFDYRHDYMPQMKLAIDGTVYACSEIAVDWSPVLAPFEELEEVSIHGLIYE